MLRFRKVFFLVLVLVFLCITFIPNIGAATYPYQDPTLSIEARLNDLLPRMTLNEKAGQMIQAERASVTSTDVRTYFLGSVLSAGGSVPNPNNPTGWCDMIDGYQNGAMGTRLAIPMIYGVDAVHGHNNVYGATIFPHNIGLGAANDADLTRRIGEIVGDEVRATGCHWTFAPCIAVPQNIKWGRTYEGYSVDTNIVTNLGVAFINGVQTASYPIGNNKSIACIKHFIGDGATDGGVDQGNASISDTVLRQKYLPPYTAGVNAGARTVMTSYSSINGLKCHGNSYIHNTILKGELGFNGFVVSDYNGIDQITSDYRTCVKTAINAGIDMIMVPSNWRNCLNNIISLVNSGEISQARIDDAVRRIVRVKMQMGLFEKPYADRSLMANFGSAAHRNVAREAVRKSLVLLKNDNNILPLAKSGKRIFVAGKCADNIGYQCGGWTMTWQGGSGNITSGTTILQGIRNIATGDTITYSANGTGAAGNDVAIVVIGETSYAEGAGDNLNGLGLDATDQTCLTNVRNSGVPTVVILVSGRPLLVQSYLANWRAFVAAWLPGTEGQGVAEVLFGNYNFSGKTAYVWPQTASQIPIIPGDGKTPLFALGAGLTYSGSTPTPTPTGASPIPTPTATSTSRNAFSQIEAESFNSQSGVQTETTTDSGGGQNVGYIENGDYVVYNNVNFGSGAASFNARVASATTGGNIEIRLDSLTGTLVGTCAVAGTGTWQTWVTKSCSVSGASGVHNLYLKFTGGTGALLNINWFKFIAGGNPTPSPTPVNNPIFNNFDTNQGYSAGPNATVTYNSSGQNVMMVTSVTGDPGNANQCVKVVPQSGSSVNASSYANFTFWIDDTQGINTIKVTMVDTANAVWSGWTSAQSTKNTWVGITMPMSNVTGINKAAIKEIRIGEWNAGTYYIDGLQFN